jgi:type VI secretion system ImpM family protein
VIVAPVIYGKLPGRGDFVRAGLDDATVDALDAWLSEGLAAWRGDDDADFAARFAAAPHYRFYAPAGCFGAGALHGVISPSVDRAGRFFFLIAGIGGDAAPVWHSAVHCPWFADATEAAVYTALGPESCPDALGAALSQAVPEGLDALPWRAALAMPAGTIFWAEPIDDEAPLVVRSLFTDAQLLARLLDGGEA